MSEAHRTDGALAPEAAPDVDRDAKIEQLLLVGLDHYFAARYDQAINVWTRALFLDRNHARARAYIDRARTALAEAQRESEELLQTGVAAFDRGDGDEARRLLLAAIDRGAPAEQAFAVLERLNRLEAAVPPPASQRTVRTQPLAGASAAARRPRSMRRTAIWIGATLILLAAGIYAASVSHVDVWSLLFLQDSPGSTAPPPPVREDSLPLPRRGEMALARARSLMDAGRLRDALAALDAVRPTDPERAEADRLRATIQRQLLALAQPTPSSAADRKSSDPRTP
jgi:tetratricopeptide (TPR) repeat protein